MLRLPPVLILMGLVLITPPTVEPITTAELKAHCRIDSSAEDTYLDTLIVSARKSVELITGRALINQTWDLTMDLEPATAVLRMPLPPLSSVTSVKYYDQDDTENLYAASNYRVDTSDYQGGRIALKETHVWPSSLRYTSGIVIRFVAGYGTAGTSVPESLRHAVKLLAAHWYENRELLSGGKAEVPLLVQHICWNYKVLRL